MIYFLKLPQQLLLVPHCFNGRMYDTFSPKRPTVVLYEHKLRMVEVTAKSGAYMIIINMINMHSDSNNL
jgi:hypothetical protein